MALRFAPSARARSRRARNPNFVPLVRSWGGVSIVYRKRLVDSPAYRLNHEEVIKALEEGISFIENMNPEEAVVDEGNHVTRRPLQARKIAIVELPARSVMVAAGTTPNITYEKEHAGKFPTGQQEEVFCAASRQAERRRQRSRSSRRPTATGAFFTSYNKDGRFISYYGDNHPLYAGNVVKAMASARDGYPHVTALFAG